MADQGGGGQSSGEAKEPKKNPPENKNNPDQKKQAEQAEVQRRRRRRRRRRKPRALQDLANQVKPKEVQAFSVQEKLKSPRPPKKSLSKPIEPAKPAPPPKIEEPTEPTTPQPLPESARTVQPEYQPSLPEEATQPTQPQPDVYPLQTDTLPPPEPQLEPTVEPKIQYQYQDTSQPAPQPESQMYWGDVNPPDGQKSDQVRSSDDRLDQPSLVEQGPQPPSETFEERPIEPTAYQPPSLPDDTQPEFESSPPPFVEEPIEPPRKPMEEPSNRHEVIDSEVIEGEEGLSEKKSAGGAAGAFSASLFGRIKKLFGGLRESSIAGNMIKNCLLLFVVGGLLYLGYAFRLHQTIYTFFSNLINPPKPLPVEVQVDEKLLREWGISTALLFGKNSGAIADFVIPPIQNAFFFGGLGEATATGETGISAAYHYGLLRDLVVQTNQFILYIKNLRTLQALYLVDVYAMLDQTTDRAKKLLDYLDDLKKNQTKSIELQRRLLAEIDDLKISFNSLSTERARFETDFFASLQGLAAEKADFLLKSFTDVAQKQATLRARLGALEKVAEYYATALARLAVRIEAVEKNKEALIEGIRVVDIPGSNIDIIIERGR